MGWELEDAAMPPVTQLTGSYWVHIEGDFRARHPRRTDRNLLWLSLP